MQVVFSKCSQAIERAKTDKSYGCFYSESSDADRNIHLHECCEVLFCLSGGKTFFIGERIYEVEDGDIFVLNPFEAHKITADAEKPFRRCVMQINPEFLYTASDAATNLCDCFNIRGSDISHKLPTTPAEREKMLHIFRKLIPEYKYGDSLLKDIAAVEFIVNVNEMFMSKNTGYTYRSDYKNKTIVNAIRYINDNFGAELSLDIIAKSCFVSVNELCKLFRQHMGTTVTKYVTSRRMTEAKKLLKNGVSVSDAAEKCGFLDYTSFIRAFKRSVGVSPGQYKKAAEQSDISKG